jgi:hypothetical protein
MRGKVYNNGTYMNVDDGLTGNYTRETLKNYISLLLYPQMTKIVDDDRNKCVIADNELVHAPSFLQYPNYEPVAVVTNRGDGMFSNNKQYHVTMLAFLLISRWFDYLKENNVWDNTRIIIMSDHGSDDKYNDIPANITLPGNEQMQRFNNILMVKDFDADSELSVDSAFMTSADIPTIAVRGIIDNPINPFTSEPLYTDKDSGVIIPTTRWKSISKHSKYTYDFKDNDWLKVNENIFKKENWARYSVEK